MRHAGGDRTMADFLACVPQAGLKAVLMAVSMAFEEIISKGQVSIEHLTNILTRLNNPSTPPIR
ncbi:hypothetical protein DBV39_09775 [Orrella marina]|uniref:Uncharacterized protein n=2 Tax=Orrella marina TaxID=2163011 RepID=A0A2R4XJR5_9BURK|nr:hypothetical protein DBV39_09775 [Orrella marina]